MPRQFLRLLRNEITKAVRRRVPYFGILMVGLLCSLICFVAGQISNAATSNAWGYASFSMQLVFTDLGPVFIIMFSAMLVAEEMSTGTIRSALSAPVHRWELYLAKAVVGLFYTMILSAAALIFSVAFGSSRYHFGAVADSAGIVYSGGQAMREFLFAYAISWIPLGALVMYGLLISTIVRRSGAAVSVGISTFFIIEFTKHLVGLDPYIFTRYIDYPWLNIGKLAQGMEYEWLPEVWKMIWLCGVSGLVTFGAGLTLFVKRDLNH